MHRLAIATRRRVLVAAGVAALLAAAGLTAWRQVPEPQVAARNLAPVPAGTAGMVVAIQPETGDFVMPSPEQLAAFGAAQAPKALGDLQVRNRPDGGQYVDVRGRFLSYSVARRGADGTLEHGCCTDPGAVARFCNEAPPAAPPAPPKGEVQ